MYIENRMLFKENLPSLKVKYICNSYKQMHSQKAYIL